MTPAKYPTEWEIAPLRKDWQHWLRYDVDVENRLVRVYVLGAKTRKVSRGLSELAEHRHKIAVVRAGYDVHDLDEQIMNAAAQLHTWLQSAAWRSWYRQLPPAEQERLYPGSVKKKEK